MKNMQLVFVWVLAYIPMYMCIHIYIHACTVSEI